MGDKSDVLLSVDLVIIWSHNMNTLRPLWDEIGHVLVVIYLAVPVADEEMNTFGFFFSCSRESTTSLVPTTRLFKILLFFASDQRPSTLKGPSNEPEAMFSPAKWITASTPSKASKSVTSKEQDVNGSCTYRQGNVYTYSTDEGLFISVVPLTLTSQELQFMKLRR